MIKTILVESIGAPIRQTTQDALQADELTPFNIVRKVDLNLLQDDKLLHLDALVVNDLDVDILAGMPLTKRNDVGIQPCKHQVTIELEMVLSFITLLTRSTQSKPQTTTLVLLALTQTIS